MSNKTKHTDAPWVVSDESIVAGDICIAVIESDGGYEAPREQRAANARLIAAAPDLLVALQCVLRVADRKTVEFDAAHAAIAKSTGERQ